MNDIGKTVMASELKGQTLVDALCKGEAYLDNDLKPHWGTRPAPAATETGLETVEYQVRSKLNGHWVKDNFLSQQLSPDTERRELVSRSQAEELLAAERAEKEEARRAEEEAKDCFWSIYETYLEKGGLPVSTEGARSALSNRIASLEADNAAKGARIKELEADLKTYQDGTTDLVNEKIDAEFKVIDLEAKLATANALVTCCCGDLVDAHNMGSGHSPVDQYHYAMMQLEAKLSAADTDAIGYRSTIEHLTQRAETAENKLAAAEKALEFYADASKWDDGYFKSEDDGTVLRAYPSSVDKDQGDKARAVLGGKPS